jgi:lipopolysaccharide/colanic/teichoic acid biosynthesis glycosyltransferase
MAFVRRDTFLLLVGDVALLVFSLWLALALRVLHPPHVAFFTEHLIAFVPTFIISIFVFFIAGLYEKETRLVRRIMGARILGAQVANTIIAAIIFFLLPFEIAPKTILALYLVISVLLIQMWRFYITPRLSVRSKQLAVLVGQGKAVEEVFEEVNNHNKYSLRFAELINTSNREAKEVGAHIRKAIHDGARIIVLDTRDSGVHGELPALYDAMIEGVTFVDFATFYEDIFDRVPLSHIDYVWLLNVLPKRHFIYDIGKRAIDIIGATIGLIIASVFIIPAALILAIEGGSPFIYIDRVGKEGKTTRLVKLRTMLFNDNGDPVLKEKNRVTTFGKFLRKTRIDELPQLYNILTGQLSFIGPRPEYPALAEVYDREIPYYGIRHVTTPGLSGWAQIRDFDAPRHKEDIEKTARKLSYDLYYLKHRSLGLDIVIALKTIRALLSFSGV